MILATSFIGSIQSHAATTTVTDTISSQTAYILSLQKPSGAITIWKDAWDGSNTINPYFANTAAMALLDANPTLHKTAVKKYIDWYFSKLNWPDTDGLYGTVYDYAWKNGVETAKWTYDSVDSYNATFLSLLRKYYEKTRDTTIFTTGNRAYLVDMIGGTIVQLQDPNTKLTNATKSYPIQYTMDNAEVSKGLADAAYIFSVVYRNQTSSLYYSTKATEVKNAIQSRLYSVLTNTYLPYFGSAAPNLKNWYPDSQAQLFPTLFWVQSDLNCARYNTFSANFPEWPNSKHSDGRFPSAFLARSAYQCGDYVRLGHFLRNTKLLFSNAGHPWPWNASEAGWTLSVTVDCNKNSLCKATVNN